jgi:ATP-dependent Clp protease adaptor protein ClpS
MNFGYQELEEVEVLEDTGLEDEKNLVVFNDEHNTFDHVINTLIKVCKHDQQQAEQCTYIIHFNGKCAVKKGELPALKLMHEGIVDAGINAEIH